MTGKRGIRAEHLKLLDEASALPPEYPGWMVEWQNREPRVPVTKA